MTALAEIPVSETPVCEIPVARDALTWVVVCALEALTIERGVAALADGQQVAVYRLADGTVAAVGNRDPFSGANVMSRGLVGTRGGAPVVFSPMFKQAFSLETGGCLDDAERRLPWYPVRIADGLVLIGIS
jgi:nitrite reductase (NADH) small subunit